MSTLDDLIYYCEEKEPAGALMLTGEWGCGKTYLIEHDLSEKMKETHIILRISLFGIETIGTLNKNVKKQWIDKCHGGLGKLLKYNKINKKIANGVYSASKIPKPVKDVMLSINLEDFISIKPKVNNKKVILVFDDLERTKLDKTDVLGIINEYCENLHFNTIIVTNEERISYESSSECMKYSIIKEKIVERTTKYIPKCDEIIHSLLYDGEWFDNKYNKFLF
nr:KAP family NTPase [Lachnospiraceae bacterium]